MSKKAFDKYLPEIESGERFNDDDFVLSDSDSIPIILGYNYKAYTDIGEIMRLNYLQKDFECVMTRDPLTKTLKTINAGICKPSRVSNVSFKVLYRILNHNPCIFTIYKQNI